MLSMSILVVFAALVSVLATTSSDDLQQQQLVTLICEHGSVNITSNGTSYILQDCQAGVAAVPPPPPRQQQPFYINVVAEYLSDVSITVLRSDAVVTFRTKNMRLARNVTITFADIESRLEARDSPLVDLREGVYVMEMVSIDIHNVTFLAPAHMVPSMVGLFVVGRSDSVKVSFQGVTMETALNSSTSMSTAFAGLLLGLLTAPDARLTRTSIAATDCRLTLTTAASLGTICVVKCRSNVTQFSSSVPSVFADDLLMSFVNVIFNSSFFVSPSQLFRQATVPLTVVSPVSRVLDSFDAMFFGRTSNTPPLSSTSVPPFTNVALVYLSAYAQPLILTNVVVDIRGCILLAWASTSATLVSIDATVLDNETILISDSGLFAFLRSQSFKTFGSLLQHNVASMTHPTITALQLDIHNGSCIGIVGASANVLVFLVVIGSPLDSSSLRLVDVGLSATLYDSTSLFSFNGVGAVSTLTDVNGSSIVISTFHYRCWSAFEGLGGTSSSVISVGGNLDTSFISVADVVSTMTLLGSQPRTLSIVIGALSNFSFTQLRIFIRNVIVMNNASSNLVFFLQLPSTCDGLVLEAADVTVRNGLATVFSLPNSESSLTKSNVHVTNTLLTRFMQTGFATSPQAIVEWSNVTVSVDKCWFFRIADTMNNASSLMFPDVPAVRLSHTQLRLVSNRIVVLGVVMSGSSAVPPFPILASSAVEVQCMEMPCTVLVGCNAWLPRKSGALIIIPATTDAAAAARRGVLSAIAAEAGWAALPLDAARCSPPLSAVDAAACNVSLAPNWSQWMDASEYPLNNASICMNVNAQVVPFSPMEQAAEPVFTSAVSTTIAFSTVVAILASPASTAAMQGIILIGFAACAPSSMKASSNSALIFLSPFASLGDVWIIYGNMVLLMFVLVGQLGVAAIVLHALRWHRSWDEAFAMVRYPHWAFTVWNLVYSGVIRVSLASLFAYSTSSSGSETGVDYSPSTTTSPLSLSNVLVASVVGVLFMLASAAALIHCFVIVIPLQRLNFALYPERSLVAAIPCLSASSSSRSRLRHFLMPVGQWEPADARARFGSFVSSVMSLETRWYSLVHILVTTLTNIVSAIPFPASLCPLQWSLFLVIAVCAAVVIGVARPHRCLVSSVLMCASYSCTAGVVLFACLLSVQIMDETSGRLLIGIASLLVAAVSVLRTAHAIFVFMVDRHIRRLNQSLTQPPKQSDVPTASPRMESLRGDRLPLRTTTKTGEINVLLEKLIRQICRQRKETVG